MIMLTKTVALQPMPFRKTAIYFGGASLVFGLSIYVAMPKLYAAGFPLLVNWLISLACFGLLGVLAISGFLREGNDWSVFAKRFRLKKMTRRAWLLAFGIFAFDLATYLGLSFTMDFLPEISWLDDSVYLKMFTEAYAGFPFEGNYWILLMHLFMLTVNVLGEELLWRGYLLPRQELVHGKRTWLVHGTCWAFFHIFHYWDVLKLLPGSLLLSYVVQKEQNTTIGIVSHALFNSMAIWVILLPKIIG